MTAASSSHRVLVTGATGFIGRACLQALAGTPVTATYRGARPDDLPGVDWVQADLSAPGAAAALCAEARATHLLALAWEVGPGYQTSVENYRWIQYSIDLLIAFAEAGGQRVAFAGTCMEYDWTAPPPFTEGVTPLGPSTDYSAAKTSLFQAFGPLCARLGMTGVWARPFFLFGPGENPKRLAADVIVSLLEKRDALCGEGTQKRDFLHVADLADAMIRLLFSKAEGPVNIGSGEAIPIADVINEIGRQIGRSDLIRLGARAPQPGDADCVQADISRLRSLGWAPKFTLETGLADTIAWWRAELERKTVT